MKADLDKSKGSFKLDLIETANADPIVKMPDMKLLAAFVSVMEWPSCNAWLMLSLACAKTGLSERQYWDSRARLCGKNEAGRVYLIPARGSKPGKTFKLINPWRHEALEHIAAMTGHFQSRENARKAARRAKKAAAESSDLSLHSVQGHEPGCPCTLCSPVPANCAGKYPSDSTPKKEGGRKENSASSNIVPFNNPRKAS